MNQLFCNIAVGIVDKIDIRHEKRTTISEGIVRGKREILSTIKKIGIGFESSSFIFNNFKTEKHKLTF